MRGKRAKTRDQEADSKYGSPVIARLINKVMQGGKKSLAEKMVYEALEEGSEKVKERDVNSFMEEVIDNVKPAMEIRARRVGGANYSIPVPVSPKRQEALVIRWIVDAARKNSGKSFAEQLMAELVNAYNKEGDAFKRKIDTEKMAEANKAFAHFRW
jgi:small subunit ribosomal protein S7